MNIFTPKDKDLNTLSNGTKNRQLILWRIFTLTSFYRAHDELNLRVLDECGTKVQNRDRPITAVLEIQENA